MKSMKDMNENKKGLEALFIDQLKDLYNAENQLVKALPKMAKAANSEELKNAFEEHLEVTQEHANRIEKILSGLNEKPTGKKCAAMEGLVKEGGEAIKTMEFEDIIKDADLIAAAQRVEHYEMAGYGTVCAFAELLGLDEAAQTLHQTLEEEKEADKTLTAICDNILSQTTLSR